MIVQSLVRRLCCLVFVMLAVHIPAHGAMLAGIVTEEGEPVAEAEVKLVNSENRVVLRNVTTDAEGTFRFTVKPGVFDILVFKTQYANTWTKGISVGDGDVFQAIELIPKVFAGDEDTGTSDDCDP